jgi:PAS domain S-box-containing protein
MGRNTNTRVSRFTSPLARSRFVTTGCIILIGIAVSFSVFALDRASERQSVRHELKVLGLERAEAVKSKVLRSTEVLYALRSFFSSRSPGAMPTRADFKAFVSAALDRQPEVMALEWAPRISAAERDRFERSARADGFPNFQITEKDDRNRLTAEAERSQYFPVNYFEPLDRNLRAAGYDILSNNFRRAAIESSRDTGDLAATAPVILAQDTDSTSSGFLVVLPVYTLSDATPPATIDTRRQQLKGFALAVFKIHDLVDSNLTSLARAGIDVELRDVECPGQIYAQSADSPNVPSLFTSPFHPSVAGMSETFPIDVAGRHWQLLLRATPAFVATRYSWQPWSVLLLCLLLTAGLGCYLWTITQHTIFVESRVTQRTSQLSDEIQERKRAELGARRAEEKFRSIFENAIEGIFQTSVDGHYIVANTALARMYGYSSPEALITALSDIAHELYVDPGRRTEFVRQIATHGAVWDFESQIYRRDRSIIWISENARTVWDANGTIAYFEGTVVDITARKAAEESLRKAHEELELRVAQRTAELAAANEALHAEIIVRKEAEKVAEDANRAKTLFLANVSHEIRTPMNAILGYSQLMSRDHALTASQRGAIQTILASGTHLMGVINDILDLSKLESGHVELVESTVDLRTLVHGVLGMFEHKARQKNLLLIADLPEIPMHFSTDEGKLRQVLINLVCNALKFTDSGGVSVIVDASQAGDCRFSVRDTGVGISPGDQQLIFEPFCQARAGLGRGGTGLGLTIARDYVRLMGGDLSVESSPGRGATFTFQIRLEPKPQGSEPASQLSLLTFECPLRALVVDDIAENREVLSAMLATLGCIVHACDSGHDALMYISQHTIDVALIDILMPGMDGFQVAKKIRQADAVTPLLAVTASALTHDPAHMIGAGFAELLHKPIRLNELAACLQRHCSSAAAGFSDSQEPASVLLSADLCANLKSAAADCCPTELKRLIREISPVTTADHRLIRDLHGAIVSFNYPAVNAIIDALADPELAASR